MKGWGKFAGPNEVEVALIDGGTTTVKSKNFMIATGSEVSPLPGIAIDEERRAPARGAAAGCLRRVLWVAREGCRASALASPAVRTSIGRFSQNSVSSFERMYSMSTGVQSPCKLNTVTRLCEGEGA